MILFLASIVLDGGMLVKAVLLGTIAYWCAVAVIMMRRDVNDTKTDRLVLRWGFVLLLVIGFLMFSVMAQL